MYKGVNSSEIREAQKEGAAHARHMMIFKPLHRDEVFVAGGQPRITYVDRQELHVERNVARAIASPNQIVSVAGPTKTGKTVLCKKLLGEREYVWIDGGLIDSVPKLWDEVCSELDIPSEVTHSNEGTSGIDGGLTSPVVSLKGSKLRKSGRSERHVRSMSDALNTLVSEQIILVVDDFHYLTAENRTTFLRNVKGAVFNGLKVVLLSVTHRAFDAIKAESELTGRFVSITLPTWKIDELSQIPRLGFDALKVEAEPDLLNKLAIECQENPFLMPKFCWEICFDNGIEHAGTLLTNRKIKPGYDIGLMLKRLAVDAGLPRHQRRALHVQPRSPEKTLRR